MATPKKITKTKKDKKQKTAPKAQAKAQEEKKPVAPKTPFLDAKLLTIAKAQEAKIEEVRKEHETKIDAVKREHQQAWTDHSSRVRNLEAKCSTDIAQLSQDYNNFRTEVAELRSSIISRNEALDTKITNLTTTVGKDIKTINNNKIGVRDAAILSAGITAISLLTIAVFFLAGVL